MRWNVGENHFPFFRRLLCLNDSALWSTDDSHFHKAHLLTIDLNEYTNGVLSRKSSVPMCSTLFPTFFFLSGLECLVSCWGPWSTGWWVFPRGIGLHAFALCYFPTFRLTSTVCWRCCLFPLSISAFVFK